LRSKVKVPQRSLWYATHSLMVMHPHTKYHWSISKDKNVMAQTKKYYLNQRLPGACNRSPGSKLLSVTTQLHCGGHLGGRAQLPYTILEEDHPMTIPSKYGSNCATGSRQDGFMWISHRVLC
jgi:hypothetical protein